MTEKLSIRLILIGLLFFLVSVILFFWKTNNLSISTPINSEKFDQFGSFISGIVGTIWSLAGIILFYVALKEQRKDFNTNQEVLKIQVNALEQQIREFELQRQELELTRKVFVEQSKTLKTQQFDSTFFNTFTLLNNITENINFSISPQLPKNLGDQTAFPQPDRTKTFHGKDSFEYFYLALKEEFQKLYGNYIVNNLKETFIPDKDFNVPLEVHEELVGQAYEIFFTKYQADLGHYFRTLYNIVKFVHEKKPDDPRYYTNLVRSQLSSFEHLLLFYNCFSEYGEVKFQPLIIEYSMLDNMPTNQLLNIKHKEFYPEEAYV